MKKSSLFFLFLFCLMTFAPIPVFYLFREQIGYSNTENKAEEPFPDLSRHNYSTWPKRFEAWLSDTLPFKTQFISLYRGFQMKNGLDYSQSDVIRGNENYLFYRKTVENYKGLTRFTDNELETIRRNIEGFFGTEEEKGTECLLFIAPDKEQILSISMPEKIQRISEISRGDQLTEFLNAQTEYPVLYPKPELTELTSNHPVYFETDTHWNELGGYCAAQIIQNTFSGLREPISIPSYRYIPEEGKDLANMLGLSAQYSEGNMVLIDFEDNVTPEKTETIDYGTIQRFISDAPLQKKLLIIGDSFAEYYLRAAIHQIGEILFVTYGELHRIDLESEAPDYIVVMLVERNLPFLLNGFY